MCEIREVQAIYRFMKVKGIGIARTNKEQVSYKQQIGAMWTLEEWLLSVLNPEQKSEYYAQYVRVDGLKTILSQPEGNNEFNGFLYIAKGSCGEPTYEASAEISSLNLCLARRRKTLVKYAVR